AVEALATGRDVLVTNAARRALVLAPQVLSAHEAVRGQHVNAEGKADRREQTLVRAFTRRFYDVLDVPHGGQPAGRSDADIRELDWDDLLALDEDDIEDEAPEESHELADLDIEAVDPSVKMAAPVAPASSRA